MIANRNLYYEVTFEYCYAIFIPIFISNSLPRPK